MLVTRKIREKQVIVINTIISIAEMTNSAHGNTYELHVLETVLAFIVS